MVEVKFFNRWSSNEIKIQDPGLVNYINLQARFVPKTGGRNVGTRFHKSRTSVVERLMNKVMVSGHKSKKHFKTSAYNTGKGNTAYNIIEKTFEIVESRTKQNPIAVLVKAIENAAPREEIIMIEYGGAHYPKPVEVGPQRRVDFVLKLMAQASYQKSFNSKKAIENCLAEEIIAVFNVSPTSACIAKKHEMERQADSSR